jgi:hypothetical protein
MRSFLCVPFALLAISCNKSTPIAEESYNDTRWTIGNYTYTKTYSTQTKDYFFVPGQSKNIQTEDSLVVINCYGSGGSGPYSASTLTINVGTNPLFTAPINTLGKYLDDYISISCRVGTGSVSNLYAITPLSNSDTVISAVDNNGMCHINLTHPITLFLTATSGGGIPGADSCYTLTLKDAF